MKITVYTKDYCPYCIQAKNLLSSIGASYEEVDVTDDPDMFRKIYERSHMRTVPQIFLGDICLGGYSDIRSLYDDGKLMTKLGL